MILSIIIVNYNVYKHLIECIKAIKNSFISVDYEIIVVDNNSSEKVIDDLNILFPEVKLIKLSRNRGFGAANNAALKFAAGKYFLFINPDIIVKSDCIQKLLKYIEENDKTGIVAPILFRPTGKLDYYNSFFPSMYSIIMLQLSLYNRAGGMKKRTFDFFDKKLKEGKAFRVEQAMGACILTRKSIFEKLGGFDEVYFLYQEETDVEYRMAKEGWEIIILPNAEAIHDHHASTNNLGKIFIGFHWLRSIIIFYVKNFPFFKKNILRITMFFSLILRELKYCIIYFFKPKKLLEISVYTFKLIMLNFLPRNYLLRDRFVFENSKI